MKKASLMLVGAMICLLGTVFACETVKNATEGFCGDCGTIANGDATITGMAQLDGVFKSLGTLSASTGSIRADFDAEVRELAAVFGIDTEGLVTADVVTEIKAEFDAQINAHLDGGISVVYEPPSCSADLSVSASAQAQCEAKAGCDADVSVQCEPGELSVECEGKCSGGCSGTCEGSCTVSAEAAASCEGKCKGSCDLSASGGSCEGTCHGECDVGCELENAEGECHGECAGTCTGDCELPEAGGSCEGGECRGECTVSGDAALDCEGKCEGACEGQCTGGCEGSFDPPSCGGNADVECEATADCQAQASAQASASMSCTPPTLQIDYELSAGADAAARAAVMGKLEAFKARMIAIVQGFAELRALLEGNAELGIDPPLVTIAAQCEAFLAAVIDGEVEIEAPGLLPCAEPAFEEALALLDPDSEDGIYMSLQATVTAQLDLLTLLDIG